MTQYDNITGGILKNRMLQKVQAKVPLTTDDGIFEFHIVIEQRRLGKGKTDANAKDKVIEDSSTRIQDLQKQNKDLQKELQKVHYQIQPILCKPPMKNSALHASNSDLLYAGQR